MREAIDCYEQALALDYDRVEWRFNRARLLADVGDVAEAIREAKTCLHLRPEHAGAGRLIDRLLSDPRVLGQSITAP